MFKRKKKKRSREFKNLNKVIDLEQAREERRNRRKELSDKKQSKDRQSEKEELSDRKINKRNRKRLIYVAIVLGIIGVIGVSVFRVISLQNEYKEIATQNKELRDVRQSLTAELGNVNNIEYIEQQAREQLRMIMPGEVLFILPTEGGEATSGVGIPSKGEIKSTLPSSSGTTTGSAVEVEEDIL
jgi:cell division protein FtsB